MKFLNIFFCEDIRQEINNKISLMGLYDDKMVLTSNKQDNIIWPQPVNLAALLRFSIEKDDEQPNRLEFEYYLNKSNILKINQELNLDIKNKTQFQLVIKGMGLPIQPGNLSFSINIYAKNKLLLSEKQESTLNISLNE